MSDNKKQMMDIQKVKFLALLSAMSISAIGEMISFQGRRMIQNTTMTVVAPDLTFRCRKAENLDQ